MAKNVGERPDDRLTLNKDTCDMPFDKHVLDRPYDK